jgi:type I restriction enzyme M protein
MQDDVFLVMHEGWINASRPRPTVEDKDRKLSETPDLEIGSGRNKTKYKMDLIPPSLVVARYFADDQDRVDELNAEAEAATQAVEEYVEEYGGDEGLLSDALNDKGKLTQAAAKVALKEARALDDEETMECAQRALELLESEAMAKQAAKQAQAALDTAILKKYGDLSESEVQSLLLDDKWAATIRNRVVGEISALTLDLVTRIQQLGERYAETVGALDSELGNLECKVAAHLATMGVK